LPPVTLALRLSVLPAHNGRPPLPDGAILIAIGDKVLKEISSNPKSFPPAAVCRSIIERVVEVAEPEFHVP